MVPMTLTAAIVSATLIGQQSPAIVMPGRTNQEIIANCISYIKSDKPTDRSFAIATLGLMGKDAKPTSRYICQAFLDKSPAVQEAANLALPKVNQPLYVPVKDILNKGNQPKDYDTRLRGLEQLAALKSEGEPAIPVILHFMGEAKAPDRPRVVDTLASVGSNDAGLTALFGNWLRSYPDPAVRLQVLKVLPRMKDANLQVSNLIGAINSEKETDIRKEAILTLGKVGQGNDAARKTLESLLLDPSPDIREAAKQALKNLDSKRP